MNAHAHRQTPNAAVAGVVSLLVLAVGLVVTAADLPMAWVVWPLGYGVVLPLAIGYAARRGERTDEEPKAEAAERDPAARLRQRYVAGEIDEREFERKLEVVMEEAHR